MNPDLELPFPDNGFLYSFDHKRLTDVILQATERLYLSLPGLFDETAICLIELKKTKAVDIRVIVDVDENTIRNGFGEFPAIEKLRDAGIRVYEAPGNRVSFIIADNKGYFLFPTSVIFGDEVRGRNAILMDPITQVRLVATFFPPVTENEQDALQIQIAAASATVKDRIDKAIEQIQNPKEDEAVAPPNQEVLNEIKCALEANPPATPDLQQKIRTYQQKVQWVELSFNGANIPYVKVDLPPDVLPFKDQQIKKALEAKLRLFSDEAGKADSKRFVAIEKLKEHINIVRGEYLTAVKSRKKSILRMDRKADFKKAVEGLQEEAKQLTNAIPKMLADEILKSKARIRNELVPFLTENPPDEAKGLDPESLGPWIEQAASDIVARLKVPKLDKLAGRVSITCDFYDLTYEDFADGVLLEEFKKLRILRGGTTKSIVYEAEAFKAKADETQRT